MSVFWNFKPLYEFGVIHKHVKQHYNDGIVRLIQNRQARGWTLTPLSDIHI